MKARNLLWISIVNIFLLLLVSVIMEYGDLNSRFKQLQYIVSTATDTSVRTSTASEELFTEKYKLTSTTSYGGTNSNRADSKLKVLSPYGNSWITGNTYVMSMFYKDFGRFPKSQAEYDSYDNAYNNDESIYSWLFGKVGSVYNHYYWANKGTKLWMSSNWYMYGIDRTPTDNFRNFYNNIGKYMTSNTYVKAQISPDNYHVEVQTIPTLTQMGLELDTLWNGNSGGGSVYTNDYLSSVVHFGKTASGIADTSYYLTPYSLGVTYVPVEVLKPVFLSHLEQLIRFNKVKHTVSSSGSLSDFASANGCMSTDVYVNGIIQGHKETSFSNILNDGQIEYDLSTAQVKVDYFLVDFYNTANYLVANKIEGSIPNKNNLLELPLILRDKDTSPEKNGNRIVAKVSVKLKIHIPYKSSVLQWFRHLYDTDGCNHYDIRLWDEKNNMVDFNSNGVWFYYTTYTAISR